MLNFATWRAIVIALLSCLPLHVAEAKTGYPLAEAYESCRAYQKRESAKFPGNAIFMANSIGTSVCLFSDYPLAEAQASALKACQQQTPSALRKLAPCQLVALNGKIKDSAFFRALTQDYRIPVQIRSWNGAEKREEDARGFIIFGRADVSKTPPMNEARLVRADGLEICKGWVKSIGLGQSLGFEVDCIGGNRLTGTARLTGLIKVGGYYRAGSFKATIRNPPHKVEFWTN